MAFAEGGIRRQREEKVTAGDGSQHEKPEGKRKGQKETVGIGDRERGSPLTTSSRET
jgi:hypothetical protein